MRRFGVACSQEWTCATPASRGPLPGCLGDSSIDLSDERWEQFCSQGFLPLGRTLDEAALAGLTERIDDLMLGRRRDERLMMQLDLGGDYLAMAPMSLGFKGPSLAYRKIENLEHDDRFAGVIQEELYRRICLRAYGEGTPIGVYRAMVMNKPAAGGTILPWHQDGGGIWGLDRDPLLTVWTALDAATISNGCVQIIPGSHRLGLLSAHGHTITQEQESVHCPLERRSTSNFRQANRCCCTIGRCTAAASTGPQRRVAPSASAISMPARASAAAARASRRCSSPGERATAWQAALEQDRSGDGERAGTTHGAHRQDRRHHQGHPGIGVVGGEAAAATLKARTHGQQLDLVPGLQRRQRTVTEAQAFEQIQQHALGEAFAGPAPGRTREQTCHLGLKFLDRRAL